MAQMLAMVCNEHQNTPITTPLALPRALPPMKSTSDASRTPPLTVFDRSDGDAHQTLDGNQLAYCDLARERQQRAYELVREQHALTVAGVNGRNFALSDALFTAPNTRLVDGYGSTIPPPLSAKVCGKALTIKSSKRNSR